MASEIVLNNENCVKLLVKYTELAQQRGAFTLSEAGILKRAIDVLTNNFADPEVNDLVAKSLLVQAVNKGQRSGAYTLSDAALLDKVVNAIASSGSSVAVPAPAPVPSTESGAQRVVQQGSVPIKSQEHQSEEQNQPTGSVDFESLDDLSAPVPLKPRVI